MPDSIARVYVGTYAKYNNGSIAGAWLDLEDYADKDAFLAACADLHKDESDPELMFQDYEGFPAAFYGESCIADELWDWLDLDTDDRELLAVYTSEIDSDGTIETARDSFMGKYDSPEDWAAEYLEETGSLSSVPEHLRNYIDFAAYARDCGYNGDVTFVDRGYHDTWVFSSR
jgi:antirestriction protein